MSTFMSYSRTGQLVAGFDRISTREHGSGVWIPRFGAHCHSPAHLNDTEVVVSDCRVAPCRITSTAGWSAPRVANNVFAGGNRWVAMNTDDGLYDGLARKLPGMGKHAVGYDGTLVYSQYHGTQGVIVEDADRHVITQHATIPVTATACVDKNAVAVFSAVDLNHVWVWNGLVWKSYKLAVPAYAGNLFRHRGRLYIANGGKIHDLEDPEHGWVVGQLGGPRHNTIGWSDGTRMWVAWSENEGADLDSVNEVALEGDAAEWPIEVPVFKKTHLKIGIGMFDDLVGPRIIDATESPSSNTKALLHDEKNGTIPLDTSRIHAAAANIPCLRYSDDHGAITPTDSNDRSLVYCYPKSNLTLAQTVARVTADVKRLHEADKPFDCAVALYCQWNGHTYALTEQQVVDTLGELWPVFLQYPPGALWIMSKNRGNGKDGVIAFDSFKLTLTRLKQASGDWTHFPEAVLNPSPPPNHRFFPEVQRFMAGETLTIKGLIKQTGWENDREVYSYIQPVGDLNAAEGEIGYAPDPSPATQLRLTDIGDEKISVVFTANGLILAEEPMGKLVWRRAGSPIGVMEWFYDGKLAGKERVFHDSGQDLLVVR